MEEIYYEEEEGRFLPREEDPLGDWEHSPDGECILIWKNPSLWPEWARWAKRLSLKFRRPFKEAFLFASWVYQLVKGSLTKEVKEFYEAEIERTCEHCGSSHVVPPDLWKGVAYCPKCGKETPHIGWDQVVKKVRKLLVELLHLEPRDVPLGCKPEVDPWVPIPLEVPPEEERESRKNGLPKIEWKSLSQATSGMKWLYREGQYQVPPEDRDVLWEKARSRKKKLLAYREMARKRVLTLFQEARMKCLRGEGSRDRVHSWTQKLPVSEETREWIRNALLREVELSEKGLVAARE